MEIAHGDGIYTTTDLNVAKTYAGSTGYILRLAVKIGRVAVWSPTLDKAFRAWCDAQSCSPDPSARTVFLLHRKYETLREGNVLVVLLKAYRNPIAVKIKTRRISVIGAICSIDGKEINLRSL